LTVRDDDFHKQVFAGSAQRYDACDGYMQRAKSNPKRLADRSKLGWHFRNPLTPLESDEICGKGFDLGEDEIARKKARRNGFPLRRVAKYN
jgi:hypothetical protein